MNDFNMRSIVARIFLTLCILMMTSTVTISSALAGAPLGNVRKTGLVRCAVGEQLAGFSLKIKAGRWEGFTVDFCRAVAAATLGDC
jgi:general L-amino acid transport system substrate-binding protein